MAGRHRQTRETRALPIQFLQHLPFQMLPRRLLDRAPFRNDCLFLRLTFFSCARIDRARQMGNLRPLRPYLTLFGFRVRIHCFDLH